MERIILKYTLLRAAGEQQITLPIGAEILSVHGQYAEVQLWALINPKEKQEEKRKIFVALTGVVFDHTAQNVGKFIGTALTYDDTMVWHVFEKEVRK